MLKLDNLRHYELVLRLLLLTLVGWTGLGGFIIPIVPNEARPKESSKAMARGRRGHRSNGGKRQCCSTAAQHRCSCRMFGRLASGLRDTWSIYCIPCIKHQLAILSAASRFGCFVAFAVRDPSEPLGGVDAIFIAFLASAALQECAQMRKLGTFEEYWARFTNRIDLIFVAVSLVGLLMRLGYISDVANAIANLGVNASTNASANASTVDDATAGAIAEVAAATWVGGAPLFNLSLADANASLAEVLAAVPPARTNGMELYRALMAILVLLQVNVLTRLVGAFETVGVLLAALTMMMMQLQRVVVPYLLLAAAFSVCFQLFDSLDGWRSPWLRFIGIQDDEGVGEDGMLMLTVWVYTIAIDVTVLNLMIAIMTDTYFKVARGRATQIHRMSRVGLLSDFLSRPVTPQPFDVPIILADAAISCLLAAYRRLRCRHSATAAHRGSASGRSRASGASGAVTRSPVSECAAMGLSERSGRSMGAAERTSPAPGSPAAAGSPGSAVGVREEYGGGGDVGNADMQRRLSRALHEYLVDVRRREQKEAADVRLHGSTRAC